MFIIIEYILFLLIFLTDLFSIHNEIIKYVSILLCFIMACYQEKGELALLFICIADIFLLGDSYWIVGILFFIVVQWIYSYHIYSYYPKYNYILLILLCYPVFESICIYYALMTLCNIISAFKRKSWIFPTLILLALCDILIVIKYLTQQSNLLIWFFYLPSQIYYVKMVPSMKKEPL